MLNCYVVTVQYYVSSGVSHRWVGECRCVQKMYAQRWGEEVWVRGPRGWVVASFPGPAHSSLAVQNLRRGPGLVHHVMCTTVVFLRHTMFAVLHVRGSFKLKQVKHVR